MTALPRKTLPCGCWRGIVRRKVPLFHGCTPACVQPCTLAGQPVLDATGAFTFKDAEELEDGYCEEHTAELGKRQLEVQRLLALGTPAEEAMKVLAGASPLDALPTPGTVDKLPEPVDNRTDQHGRRVRRRRIWPCGCWAGEMWRTSTRTLGGTDTFGMWCDVTEPCDAHAAVQHLATLQIEVQVKEQLRPAAPHLAPHVQAGSGFRAQLQPLPPQAEAILERAPLITAAAQPADALNGGMAAPGLSMLGAVARAALPAAAVPPALAPPPTDGLIDRIMAAAPELTRAEAEEIVKVTRAAGGK